MPNNTEKAGAIEPMVSWLESIFKMLEDHLSDVNWQLVGVVETPKGSRQSSDTKHFDHEYVDQHCQFEDDWHGHIYLPIGKKYLQVWFTS